MSVSAATVGAAQAVADYFHANACTTSSVPVVVAFQQSWNGDVAGTSSTLTVDGQYGPLTQGALETALGTTDVPANCFGGPARPPAPNVPPPAPGPLPPLPVNPPPAAAPSSGAGPLAFLIGAIVVAGGLAAYTYSRKKRKH